MDFTISDYEVWPEPNQINQYISSSCGSNLEHEMNWAFTTFILYFYYEVWPEPNQTWC